MSGLAVLLGAAWAVVVLGVGWVERSGPARRPPAAPGDGDPSHDRHPHRSGARWGIGLRGDGQRSDGWRGDVLRTVGARLSRAVGLAPVAARDRAVGAGLVAGALAVAVLPVWWAVPIGSAVGGAVRRRGRSAERRRRTRLADDLPDVVDLFVLAAGSGGNVALSVAAVARFADGPLASALAAVDRACARGARLADELERLPESVGEPVRPLSSVLVGAERDGTPLVPQLEALAAELRAARRRRGEVAARQAPVKLLFPLVLCALPAFALLTVVPLVLATLRSLHPS